MHNLHDKNVCKYSNLSTSSLLFVPGSRSPFILSLSISSQPCNLRRRRSIESSRCCRRLRGRHRLRHLLGVRPRPRRRRPVLARRRLHRLRCSSWRRLPRRAWCRNARVALESGAHLQRYFSASIRLVGCRYVSFGIFIVFSEPPQHSTESPPGGADLDTTKSNVTTRIRPRPVYCTSHTAQRTHALIRAKQHCILICVRRIRCDSIHLRHRQQPVRAAQIAARSRVVHNAAQHMRVRCPTLRGVATRRRSTAAARVSAQHCSHHTNVSLARVDQHKRRRLVVVACADP